MASPFSVFRKHQAAMIVVFMAMLMVAFVILPPILDMMGTGSQGGNPVVFTSRHGTFHEQDMYELIRRRQFANGFMNGVMEAALGFPIPSSYQAFGEATEAQVVNTLLLAEKAAEMGMVVTDRQVNEFLERETQNKVNAGQMANLAQRFGVSQTFIFDALRHELLARNFANLYLAGVRPTPPLARWDYYQRVFRSAKIEAAPVQVSDYIDQVADPSEAELQRFFDEYKSQYPIPGSPDPGFRQPAKGRFQYFRADYDQFAEGIDITDEEIAKYYEEHKDEFPYSGLSIEPAQPPLGGADETAPDEPMNVDTDESDAGDEGAAQPTTDEVDNADDDARDQPVEPAEPADAAPNDAGETPPEAGDAPVDARQPGDPQAALSRLPLRRVAYQPPASEDAPTVDIDDDVTETEVDSDEATDTTSLTDVDAPSDTDESDTWPEAIYILPDDIRGGPDPEHDPLWKVRDKIRDLLAAERVGKAMQEAIDRVAEEMSRYSTRLTRWEIARERNEGDGSPKPEFDAQAVVADVDGVTAQMTSLLSAREIYDQTDLGQSTVDGTAFVRVAYQDFDVYRVERSQDIEGNQYVFWKLEGTEDFVPELDQVRDEVVRAWKTIAAREPALAAAKQLRDEAAAAGKPLTELFADRSGIEVLTPPRFSWVSGGTTAFLDPQAPLRLSEVEGVVDAGPEFMRTTFDLAPGEVAVAMNHPQTIAYVIRMEEISPESIARELFMIDNFARYQSLANADQDQLTRRWVEQLQADAELTWERDADAESDR